MLKYCPLLFAPMYLIFNRINRIKLMNGTHIVNVSTGEEYHKLQNQLIEFRIDHYTYEDKNTRPVKVMTRGMDPTCTETSIAEYLKSK